MNKGFSKVLLIVAFVAADFGCGSDTAANDSTASLQGNAQPSPSITASPPNAQTPEPTPPQGPPPAEAQAIQNAIDVISQFYDAINAREFRRAYELWSVNGQASKQTFEQFRNGFANTSSAEFDTTGPGRLEGAAGSQYATIPIRIRAITKDGNEQNFVGEYVLRRSMVDGATADQRAWRIYSANIRRDKGES